MPAEAGAAAGFGRPSPNAPSCFYICALRQKYARTCYHKHAHTHTHTYMNVRQIKYFKGTTHWKNPATGLNITWGEETFPFEVCAWGISGGHAAAACACDRRRNVCCVLHVTITCFPDVHAKHRECTHTSSPPITPTTPHSPTHVSSPHLRSHRPPTSTPPHAYRLPHRRRTTTGAATNRRAGCPSPTALGRAASTAVPPWAHACLWASSTRSGRAPLSAQ